MDLNMTDATINNITNKMPEKVRLTQLSTKAG